eukprot:TRINITY_DN2108_c0_g2_i1.p1 TRINITY_DN2108_c0_g2~~TRINITY_DN2108_c0_g2_i1.p1  ORF type:complete len:211 (+),score=38.96 TRINITY_DN2108_c0_g2_i1:151-783(+)
MKPLPKPLNELLPIEFSRTITMSPREQREPLSRSAAITFRDYSVASKVFLMGYSSHSRYLEDEMLGRHALTSRQFFPKLTVCDDLKPEYFLDLESVKPWMKQGVIRKGVKIGDEQGIILLKSIKLEPSAEKKQLKDFFVPFYLLPRMLYLKSSSLLHVLGNFLAWNSSNGLALKQVKDFTEEMVYKKHYKMKSRLFFTSSKGAKQLLWVR